MMHCSRFFRVSLGIVWLSVSCPGLAHEGHEPLPTKGASVDAKRGTVQLAALSRVLLDVRTLEVKQMQHVQRSLAFTTIESPWNQEGWASPRLSGRLVQIYVRSGEKVALGQVLAELESRELEELYFDYQGALRRLENQQRVLELLQPSVRSGAVPELRVIEAESGIKQVENELWVLRSKASALNALWNDTDGNKVAASNTAGGVVPVKPQILRVLAPISGTVLQQDAVLGQFVDPSNHLFTIIDNSSVWARLHMMEKDVGRVAIQSRANVFLNGFPDQSFPTRVDKISYGIDSVTQQFSAWCRVENKDRDTFVLPGMTGQSYVETRESAARLSVPRSAVWSDGIAHYVFVETAATKQGSEYEKRLVWVDDQRFAYTADGHSHLLDTTAKTEESEYIELLAGGIFSGDRLVVQGAHEMSSLLNRQVLVLDDALSKNLEIEYQNVDERAIDRVVNVDAIVELPPMQRTRVATQMQGSVSKVLVDRSEQVRAGQVLAEISSFEAVTLQLEFVKTVLDLELQSNTYRRLETAGGTISPRTLLELKAKIESLQLRQETLYRQLQLIGFDDDAVRTMLVDRKIWDTIPLRSPIDGVVVDFLGTPGRVVRAGEDLFQIHDLRNFLVQVYVATRDISSVRVEQRARIRLNAYPLKEFEGKVVGISPSIDNHSGIQSVWLAIQGAEELELRDRMLGRASIVIGSSEPRVVLPKTAIVQDGLRSFAFVRQPNGEVERRKVDIEPGDDRFVYVRRGVSLGESVAVSRVSALQTAYASVR
ncbi:MAG: efflux RND transporter periplasmic adaptor subunit [Planctomycetes bacterium]|nr:efflux RND transporter periplasmic adaptor subunit [Planctomycetota bacterium]